MDKQIILASNSPRRKELLTQIGLTFRVEKSDVHEDFSIALPPHLFAEHYSSEKALDVAQNFKNELVIGADTIVVLDDQILGKPNGETESRKMLNLLSARTHKVITGVTIVDHSLNYKDTFHEITAVTFNSLESNEIEHYIKYYKPFDKAGSYGIQDWFSIHVNRIEGCFYNVVGFPLSRFYESLKKYSDISGIRFF